MENMNDQMNGRKDDSEFATKVLPMFSVVLFLLAVRYFLNGKVVMGIVWVVIGVSMIVVSAYTKYKNKHKKK